MYINIFFTMRKFFESSKLYWESNMSLKTNA